MLSTCAMMSSCVINFQVNGIHDGYPTLTENQKSLILQTEDFSKMEAGNVYEITGKDLRRELGNRDQSVVNIFVNTCAGDRCYPMQSYFNYQENNQTDLFLIMCDYFGFDKTMDQEPEFPLFAINTQYYAQNKQKKYRRLFLQELLGLEKVKEVEPYVNKFLFFQGDSLVAVKDEIFE
ncbi:hypothetical protein SAMN05216474_2420 [Lishizhenia tianjinensis]|uniref:Uncharacterized protein n=2 Tax=Lishizhenia tianjinensis TaxID=477690 RepID=A0A1I7AZJ0_9FLAO|nr:hypothetical protein SAMN05216474_2420 [Lishizhenia tianjinensis]